MISALLATASAADNENRTLDLLAALSSGRLSIDADAMNTVDRSFANGHFYSGGAPGLAFALFPARFLLHFFMEGPKLVLALTLLGAALPLALSAVAVRRAVSATGATPETARAVAALHALGTIALPFAVRLYAHSLVICLLGWALALILEHRRTRGDAPRPRGLALAGALAAFAVVCDYNVALVAGALLVLAAIEERHAAIPFVLGALGPAVLLGAYHTACFGAPWRTPYDFHHDPHTLEIVKHAYGFSWPRPRIVLELLFGTRRGFLFTQPMALAGLVALASLARREAWARFALGVSILVILANAARVYDWRAGQSFGARYAAAALPFLALGYARVLEQRWVRIPIVVASAALAFVGAAEPAWGFDIFTSLQTFWAVGPRATSLVVLLGLEDPSLGAVLASALALAVAVPVSVWLIFPSTRLDNRALLALIPPIVSAHALGAIFYKGTGSVDVERRMISRAQVRRAIAASADIDEARSMAGVIAGSQRVDLELYELALGRILEIDANDAAAKAELERIRQPPPEHH